jgi:hypothetical protein
MATVKGTEDIRKVMSASSLGNPGQDGGKRSLGFRGERLRKGMPEDGSLLAFRFHRYGPRFRP